jgi:hypothetical protein
MHKYFLTTQLYTFHFLLLFPSSRYALFGIKTAFSLQAMVEFSLLQG